MATLRGTSLVFLLVTLTVACDGSPTAPTPILNITPAAVAITVEIPYSRDPRSVPPSSRVLVDVRRGISDATVICLDRCDGRQTAVTDEQGRVTFTGFVPITIGCGSFS